MRIIAVLLVGLPLVLAHMGLVTAMGWVTLWPLNSLAGCLSLSGAIAISGMAGLSLLVYKERKAACITAYSSS